MLAPAIPDDEETRIATLRELLVLDTLAEERFDLLTQYAASQFEVQIALVSLVDVDRQWFKSACGLDASETSREISFCGHAILQSEIFEISDTLDDARFADNPLVIGPPFIRFYAGMPLSMANGQKIGTLCLIDPKPKRLDSWERGHLRILAKLVAEEIQGQSATEQFERLKAAERPA